jgi:hypothetical protein
VELQAVVAEAARAEGTTKTEVSETVTVVANIKTTVITYSDGTSDTTTTAATPADLQKYETQSQKQQDQISATKPTRPAPGSRAEIPSTIAPGSLLNLMA